ncbi:sialate O-acetylesterase [Pontiellaceae bacterium B12219]|nr:sialate O-acetylesterase [Pontiellaceae bacterium B12219]
MKHVLRLSLLLFICSAQPRLYAEIKLAVIFSDHMVLQQNQKVPIWGTTEAGASVAVSASWDDVLVSTTADREGQWKAFLTTPKGETNSYQLVVTSKDDSVTLTDVVAGEVWFCAGQSNMRFQLSRSKGVEQDIALADNSQIRLFQRSETGWQPSTYDMAKDFSAVGFYFGLTIHEKLDVPVGLIQSAVGGSPAESWVPLETLQNESALQVVLDRWDQWKAAYDAALKEWEEKGKIKKDEPEMPRSVYSIKRYHHQRGILFKDNVEPFIPFAIKGVIWYQGESNVEWPDEYEVLFSSLITSWRTAWGQGNFPFYYVQIPPYEYPPEFGINRAQGVPILREGQNRLQRLENTGMACAMDVGDPKNVHPNQKKPIGLRLARIALNKTYGFSEIEYIGPTFKQAAVSGRQVVVEFDHSGNGLMAKEGPAKWFELAGADGVYYPATAELKGSEVILLCDQVSKPVKLRYAWRAEAVTNLYNSEGLPAVPFQVDLNP